MRNNEGMTKVLPRTEERLHIFGCAFGRKSKGRWSRTVAFAMPCGRGFLRALLLDEHTDASSLPFSANTQMSVNASLDIFMYVDKFLIKGTSHSSLERFGALPECPNPVDCFLELSFTCTSPMLISISSSTARSLLIIGFDR